MSRVPGETLLRHLMAIVEGGENPEGELRAAVDAFFIRARDAKVEREFLHQLPEEGSLVGALREVENTCRDFSKALEIHLLEWPPRFPPPPDALISAMAGALVSVEFGVATARLNVSKKEEDHGIFSH